jgi:hypothetical protein
MIRWVLLTKIPIWTGAAIFIAESSAALWIRMLLVILTTSDVIITIYLMAILLASDKKDR